MIAVREALRAIGRRSRQTTLAAVSVAVGIATLTALTGITEAAGTSIASRFDTRETRIVRATLSLDPATEPAAGRRVRALPGVSGAGLLTETRLDAPHAAVRPRQDTDTRNVPTVFATPAGLRATGAHVIAGTVPPAKHWADNPDTVLVGATLARQLGVWPETGRDHFVLNDQTVHLAAVLEDGEDRAVLTGSVIVNPSAAALVASSTDTWTILVATEPGYGQLVADALPYALDPAAPERVAIGRPADPVNLRTGVTSDTRQLVTGVGCLALLAAALGVAAAMVAAVRERRAEVGIRIALGAGRRTIATQFLTEATATGLAGGLAGFGAGVLINATVCLAQGWAYCLPPWLLSTPLLGAAVAGLAGAVPAGNAATLDPNQALRT